MGLLYTLAQKTHWTELLPQPTDRFELVDRIKKLEGRGAELTELVLTPRESNGGSMWEGRLHLSSGPVEKFLIEYLTKFSDGNQYRILEYFADVNRFFFHPWIDRSNPHHRREAQQKGRYVVREEIEKRVKWFEEQGYSASFDNERYEATRET